MKKIGLTLLAVLFSLPLVSCGKTELEGNSFSYSEVTILHVDSCDGKELSKKEIQSYVKAKKTEYASYYDGIYFHFGEDGKVKTNYFTDVSLTETFDYENKNGTVTIYDNDENPLQALFKDRKLYVQETEQVEEDSLVRGVYYTVYR